MVELGAGHKGSLQPKPAHQRCGPSAVDFRRWYEPAEYRRWRSLHEASTADDLKRLFDVHVFGVHRVNQARLPSLLERPSGLKANISSLLGHITMPFCGPCNTSRWALEALSENHRSELSAFGIEV